MDNSKNDTRNNKPLSEASERIRYQVKHFDMMGDFANAAAVIRRNGLFATPTDVSPELAKEFRIDIERTHAGTRGDVAQYWLEPSAETKVAQ